MLQERINFKTYRKGSWQLLPSLSGIALLLLLFLALVPLPVLSAHAEGDNGATTFSAWLSPSVTLTMADSVSEDIEPTVSGTFKNLATVAHVEVNNSDYYEVSLHASSKDMVSSSTTNDPQAKISSITAAQNQASFSPNQWGYNLTKNATGVTTATPTTTDTEYQPIATTATAMPGIGKQATTNNAASDYYTLNFGAKVDTSIPAGLYSSTVTLSVVASPKQVYGFDRTDTMQGMTADICKEIGTDADLTNGGATKYAATDSLGNTYYTKRLKDLRDGKLYWVAKLKDGNCWMTQNLALDIPTSGLTSELTALAPGKDSWKPLAATRTPSTPNRFTIAECAGLNDSEQNTCLNKNAGFSWNEGEYVLVNPRIASSILYMGIEANRGGLAGFANPENIPEDVPEKMLTKDRRLIVDVSDSNNWTASLDKDFAKNNGGYAVKCRDDNNCVSGEYDSHYLIGNFYQWFTATAQTTTEGQVITNDKAGTKINGSICPKGWELPTSGSYGEGAGTLSNPTYNSASGSFFSFIKTYAGDALAEAAQNNWLYLTTGWSSMANIIKQVNGVNISIEDIITGPPMYFLRAGEVSPFNARDYIAGVGGVGYLWSSVVNASASAHYVYFNPADVGPSYRYDFAHGFPVRCLLNTAE